MKTVLSYLIERPMVAGFFRQPWHAFKHCLWRSGKVKNVIQYIDGEKCNPVTDNTKMMQEHSWIDPAISYEFVGYMHNLTLLEIHLGDVLPLWANRISLFWKMI